MSDESHHERELGGQLLASVSRSFYLTLKALPKELREPISLAYLLARTADTIADTASVDAAIRLDCLERYRALVRGTGDVQSLANMLIRQFCPQQSDDAERRLMEKFADGIAWMRTMQPAPLAAIQSVLEHIIDGQMLDIRRFPSDGQLRRLASAKELDEYTWLVAGCVGEFWTQLCASELPASLDPAVSTAQMQEWGARMGKGLQLINILRDIGEDTRDGRCYLPCQPEDIQTEWSLWLQTCTEHLECGLRYVQHVAHGKLRYATALPLLLGIQTVAKMRTSTWDKIQQGVKISRLDVASILAQAAIACRSAGAMEKLYRKLAEA
ncbi:phytoene/squalene synthase family protein [Prosthecobacter vanneervenii]|uniref:Farnesyl-diphosphate farnesyltransferase n=1 Tax=Prosthecobacter vanneervenii TaxID=48466 RepID=A0A7W7YC96_9BACT|nr:squalene/phytoene synthase family protein [Prosthecobacter vanneervenii]MBB5033521.1 farnesyl-diphosphate farnesyltransferase [Prosthecobacter vanneervenii]